MKKDQIKALRQNSNDELKQTVKKLDKDLFDLTVDKINSKQKNVKLIWQKRKEIAIVKTLIREKEIIK